MQNAWLVKPLNLSNQGIQTIFEAGIGFAVSGIANVRLSYRKPSWKKTAETLIRLNWPLGLWSGYGVGPVKKRVKREKPKSTQMAKSKQPVQKIGKRKDGIDMVSAAEPKLMPKPVVTASWISGEVGAGKIAKLNLTVANQGKGDLYRFVAETDSRLSIFDQQRLEFGRIPPNGSHTLSFNFPTNPEATSQEVAVLIQFEEYNDYTPDAIMTRLYIVEEERPRFEYAYRIVDGGTERSVGNGDGIIQYGESFDLVLTVRNSGKGKVTM